MDQEALKQRLVEDGLLRKIKKLGVKEKGLLDLLSSPSSSPNQGLSLWSLNLHRLKTGRKHLESLLLQTAREIERVILPVPKSTWEGLSSCDVDIAQLVDNLRRLARHFNPPLDFPQHLRTFSDLLKRLPKGKKGRPSITSPRDHRIWQLAALFKKSTGNPHYDLVADIMSRIYDVHLDIDQVKKAVARHPNERTHYPIQLKHLAPTKVVKSHSPLKKGVTLYAPPGEIYSVTEDNKSTP